MILEKGDMFQMWGKTDIFVITTNPIVTKLGKAVMGAGIAKQIADRCPEVPFVFGKLISDYGNNPAFRKSGMITVVDNQNLGYFMVKEHWAEPAVPEIIEQSVKDLNAWINYCKNYKPEVRVDLNFPGIGNGKLPREVVLPLIQDLPDCVHVWELR